MGTVDSLKGGRRKNCHGEIRVGGYYTKNVSRSGRNNRKNTDSTVELNPGFTADNIVGMLVQSFSFFNDLLKVTPSGLASRVELSGPWPSLRDEVCSFTWKIELSLGRRGCKCCTPRFFWNNSMAWPNFLMRFDTFLVLCNLSRMTLRYRMLSNRSSYGDTGSEGA